MTEQQAIENALVDFRILIAFAATHTGNGATQDEGKLHDAIFADNGITLDDVVGTARINADILAKFIGHA